MNKALGIDIGGSGIKGAIVNVDTGELLSERIRLETPAPATPEQMAKTVQELVHTLQWEGPIGCGFPAIIQHGIALSAANIDNSWINIAVNNVFGKATGNPVYALNDADAAGLAAVRFGLAKDKKGIVLLVTIGTGIGSALFLDGKLIPNTEFGHLYLRNQKEVAEKYASNQTRKLKALSWKQWGKRLNNYLQHMERLLSPDMIILSGGLSKNFGEYVTSLQTRTPVQPSIMLNNAGIVGAAVFAYEQSQAT